MDVQNVGAKSVIYVSELPYCEEPAGGELNERQNDTVPEEDVQRADDKPEEEIHSEAQVSMESYNLQQNNDLPAPAENPQDDLGHLPPGLAFPGLAVAPPLPLGLAYQDPPTVPLASQPDESQGEGQSALADVETGQNGAAPQRPGQIFVGREAEIELREAAPQQNTQEPEENSGCAAFAGENQPDPMSAAAALAVPELPSEPAQSAHENAADAQEPPRCSEASGAFNPLEYADIDSSEEPHAAAPERARDRAGNLITLNSIELFQEATGQGGEDAALRERRQKQAKPKKKCAVGGVTEPREAQPLGKNECNTESSNQDDTQRARANQSDKKEPVQHKTKPVSRVTVIRAPKAGPPEPTANRAPEKVVLTIGPNITVTEQQTSGACNAARRHRPAASQQDRAEYARCSDWESQQLALLAGIVDAIASLQLQTASVGSE